jgi:glucokinase
MTQSYRPSITRILVEMGETNMRCAILDGNGMRDVRVFKLADHNSLAGAIDHYCRDVSFKREAQMGLMIALAPQPRDGVYLFKNYKGWDFRPQDLLDALGLASVHILNDLESHAYAVLGGALAQAQVIRPGEAKTHQGPICLIAPGTGLGWSYLFPEAEKPFVQGTFGAHIHFFGFGPDDDIFKALRVEMGDVDIMIEDVVSGPGLARLRRLVSEEKADTYFLRTLGFFIHNVVIYTHSLGGIVISGGLIPALIKENKVDWALVHRHFMIDTIQGVTGNMNVVPWYLIDDPLLGLKGLIAWAKLDNFR